MNSGERGEGGVRELSVAVGVAWFILVALQFGWGAPYAWGYNLWQYFSLPALVAFVCVSAVLCVPGFRGWLFRAPSIALGDFHRIPAARVAVFLGIVVLFWALRERELYGDSSIIILAASEGYGFVFPDVGASFLIVQLLSLGQAYDPNMPGGLIAVQLAVCLCGALTVAFVFRACEYVAPGWQGAATGLILCGGLLRIFAGHVEVYAFLIAAAALYLWAAVAFIAGRVSLWVPSIALGFAVWLHLAAVCLLPSLMLLPWLAQVGGRREKSQLGRSASAAVLALLPLAVFLLGAFFTGAREELAEVARVVRELTGTATGENAVVRLNRVWGGDPTAGTDYVMLSAGHLKYLVNAAHLLSPMAAPLLVGILMVKSRTLWLTQTSRFLAVASFPLGLYAILLRPVWGPFDWDLFSLTAFFFSVWAAHCFGLVVPAGPKPRWWQDAYTWLVGSTVIFVTLPFLLIAPGPSRNGGPLSGDGFDLEMRHGRPDPDSSILPWL